MSKTTAEHLTMTFDQWVAEGRRRFGPDRETWRFVCPSCGHVATPADWRAAGAEGGGIAFSCVGRWLDILSTQYRDATFKGAGGPCLYAGGGLFRINPVWVVDPRGEIQQVFAFAP